MTRRLVGKRVVITGAAGGIGAAAARAFVDEGAVVGLVDRPGVSLESLARGLGTAATMLPADVESEHDVESALDRWTRERGGLDVLYACAGVQLVGEDAPVHDTRLDVWRRTFGVNATGAFLSVKHAVRAMVAGRGGSVILCGSPTALTMSGAGYSAYSASKAAAMALIRVVAADYASAGIRANIVVPGTIETPLISILTADPARRERLVGGTPIDRLGAPTDLVGIAVFLASDESSFATGATFAVDGGLSVR